MRSRLILALTAAALLVAALPSRSEAASKVYSRGYYSGHTSAGTLITFVVAGGKVSQLLSQMTDTCPGSKWYVNLTPKPAQINALGDWSHRTPGSFPTVYQGRIIGTTATGTIDDTSKNNRGQVCHGHISFRASRSNPVGIGSATVGPRGTDVLLHLSVYSINNGNEVVPDTNLALLVYGSNAGCPSSYARADAQARSVQSFGFIGLISDAYVTADYGFALFKSYHGGVFTFDVNTNSLLRSPSGKSPFKTVCVMLYSGKPATLTPSHNLSLVTTHGRLKRGPGVPNNQP